jgi:hypothetical protein
MTTFKLGRLRPSPTHMRMQLGLYMAADLPVPPTVEIWASAAEVCLSQMYKNDVLGDCTAAGAGHILGVWRGNAGNGDQIPTDTDVVAFYSKTTGYVPGNESTDQGGDEIVVLNKWRDEGFFADTSGKILGWGNVNGANALEVKQALYLFENVYFGVELPDAWINPGPQGSGFVWDVAGPSNPQNGHCFVGVGYNAVGVQVCSWGMVGTITWAAIAKYATTTCEGELHVALSSDVLNRAQEKAPNGFDAAQLTAYLKSFAA